MLCICFLKRICFNILKWYGFSKISGTLQQQRMSIIFFFWFNFKSFYSRLERDRPSIHNQPYTPLKTLKWAFHFVIIASFKMSFLLYLGTGFFCLMLAFEKNINPFCLSHDLFERRLNHSKSVLHVFLFPTYIDVLFQQGQH